MSDIPVISITKEFSDEELDDVAKLNINDALTDTEDLIMDQDSVRYRKSPTKCGNSLVDAIIPTTNGSVTDVEDCTDSDEDEGEVKSAREAEITLENFLDQGYVDETTNSGNKGAKPKRLTHCSSKATEQFSNNTLGIVQDTSAALTDCEDLSDDDDSLGHVSIPDCPEDILTRANDNDAVAIHNVVKRRQDKHFHKQEAAEASSSESEEDSKVRHRKCHRKAEDRPKSEYENLMISDEEMSGACAKPSNRRSALFEAEELVMEGSDVEEDKPQAFPEINITFVSDDREAPVGKPTRKRPASLAVQTPNADEAVTDVENLNSSDSEEEAGTTPKRLMPRAVVKGGKVGGGTTDVEDFNDSDDNEDNEQKNEVSSEFLPSPVREIAIVKQDECGEQRQNVMPLNRGMLTVRTPDIEQALTDVEDMSDTEEVGEMYDSSKYTIESLPEMDDGDNVYSSDNTRTNSGGGTTLEVTSPARDPVTDTEDLFFEQSASTGGSGSELRRRRKTKQCHSASQQQQQQHQSKGKKHLEMKCDTAAAATTDVEDMYLSDETAKKCGFERAKQRRATIQFSGLMATANDGDGKTDVEFLSGDELVCERSQSPLLLCDGYSSIVKTKERNGPMGRHSETNDIRPIPMIRKISPSPDPPQNCNTDVEDIQVGSDGEEQGVTYSRAQTATPFELTRALKESGSCEIYETSPRARNELLDIKGMADGNQPEIHTDVESLDDVEQ